MKFLAKNNCRNVVLVFSFIHLVVGIDLTRRQLLGNTVDDAAKRTELCWGYNDTHIEVQLAYPTLGWLAMGLSPNGGMDQSDVLFGYVNDTTNEVVVQDRYLTANFETMKVTLSMDAVQNWQMISGSKNGTHTTIRAVRKIKTCEAMDRPFTASDQFVIYSYNYKLPDSPAGPIRKHNVRGQATVNFLQPVAPPDPDITAEITKTLEFRMSNRTIVNDADTHYYCQLTKLPTFDKKYQSIASQPIVNAQNYKLVHHMLVFVCPDLPEVYAKTEFFECGPESNSYVMKLCQGMLGGWAMGAKPTNYQPLEAGLPFTPQMSGQNIVLQIHYNNPDRLTFLDDSGMRFLLTEKVRKYDSGVIMSGILSLDWTLTMPPGIDRFHVQGQCSDQCTASTLPADGINIFAATVHMHTRGRSGVARHFRGSQEILPPIGNVPNYDFNFQQIRPVLPVRKFLPGDRVVMECNFTTINDSSPVYGGEGSMEEMCMVFLWHYPKSDLAICGNQFKIAPYLGSLGLNSDRLMKNGGFPKMRGDIAQQLFNNQDMKNRRLLLGSLKAPVTNFIKSQKWTDSSAKSLQDFYAGPGVNYLSVCASKGNFSKITMDRPPEIAYYVDPDKQGC